MTPYFGEGYSILGGNQPHFLGVASIGETRPWSLISINSLTSSGRDVKINSIYDQRTKTAASSAAAEYSAKFDVTLLVASDANLRLNILPHTTAESKLAAAY